MPLILYTVKEACDELAEQGLGITDKGLRKAMLRGDISYKKIGKVYVITGDELDEYIGRGKKRLGSKPK